MAYKKKKSSTKRTFRWYLCKKFHQNVCIHSVTLDKTYRIVETLGFQFFKKLFISSTISNSDGFLDEKLAVKANSRHGYSIDDSVGIENY